MPGFRSAFDIGVHRALKSEIVAVSSGLSQFDLFAKLLCEGVEEFSNLLLMSFRPPRLDRLHVRVTSDCTTVRVLSTAP